MSALWPFPGQQAKPVLHSLPPARFGVGDRVKTRWGSATVLLALDWPGIDGSRTYQVRHDWSDAPSGFGHCFEESELQPLVERPGDQVQDEVFQELSVALTRRDQLDLFARCELMEATA